MAADETTTEEKSSRSYWGFVLWPLAVIVFYVLSLGPVTLGIYKGTISENVLVVYEPLDTVIGATRLKKPFGMYLHLWCPAWFDKNGKPI
jgi:hypothetical protein